MIYQSIEELIGKTPLLRLHGMERRFGARAEVLAKLEFLNPTGSVKDRPALHMIRRLEEAGKIGKDTLLIEPTSGNTGIGLACVCAVKGYTLVLTMPETMSEERRKLLSAYGAKIVLTPGALGMQGAIDKAEQLHREHTNSVIVGQFTNPDNPEAHYRTTGPELWFDTDGRLDCIVAGVGTGGTLTGTAKYLKERDPRIRAVAVEPEGSPVLSGGKAGAHGLQGIGAGFVPKILDTSLIDEVIAVSDADAYMAGRTLARPCGRRCGWRGAKSTRASASPSSSPIRARATFPPRCLRAEALRRICREGVCMTSLPRCLRAEALPCLPALAAAKH